MLTSPLYSPSEASSQYTCEPGRLGGVMSPPNTSFVRSNRTTNDNLMLHSPSHAYIYIVLTFRSKQSIHLQDWEVGRRQVTSLTLPSSDQTEPQMTTLCYTRTVMLTSPLYSPSEASSQYTYEAGRCHVHP